jgi:hypothetical protein
MELRKISPGENPVTVEAKLDVEGPVTHNESRLLKHSW